MIINPQATPSDVPSVRAGTRSRFRRASLLISVNRFNRRRARPGMPAGVGGRNARPGLVVAARQAGTAAAVSAMISPDAAPNAMKAQFGGLVKNGITAPI